MNWRRATRLVSSFLLALACHILAGQLLLSWSICGPDGPACRSNGRAPPAAVRLDPPGLHIEHDAFLQHSKHSTATMVAGISKALAQSASCASCRCCARQLARVWAQRGRSPSARPNRAGQYRTRRRICFLPKPYGLWVVCCSLSISHLACVLSLALALAAGAGVRRGQTRHDQGG